MKNKKVQNVVLALVFLTTILWLSNMIAPAPVSISAEEVVVTDLAARAKCTKITLTWTHIGADSYNVYRKDSGGEYAFLANVVTTYSTYLDTPISLNVSYTYKVTAVVGGIEGEPSNEVTIISRSCRECIVNSFTCESMNPDALLGWSTSLCASVSIDNDIGGSLPTSGAAFGEWETTYTLEAINSRGVVSDTAIATCPAAPPPSPENLVAMKGTCASGEVDLSWDPSPGAEYYNILWSGTYDPQTTTENHFTVSGLFPCLYTIFSVQACNSTGCSFPPSVVVENSPCQCIPPDFDFPYPIIWSNIKVGTPQTFTGLFMNAGGDYTGSGFYNIFQIATAPDGGGDRSVISVNWLDGPIDGGYSNSFVSADSYEFTYPGDYSIRFCVDNDSSFAGRVAESNEMNNCSGWLDFSVSEDQYSTINIIKTGSGIITSNVGGIVCGSNCSNTYTPGEVVVLHAEPDSGRIFIGWGGACRIYPKDSDCTLTVGSSNETVYANFTITPEEYKDF